MLELRGIKHRLVHEYQNGERWADLHPAVRQVRRERERLGEKWQ
jgi:hypothetical protein